MAKLIDLIDYQQQNALSLHSILQQEREAITSRESVTVEKLAKEKLKLLSQLEQTDQRIASHQDVRELDERTVFQDKVKQIKDIIKECQGMNDSNGEALKRAQLSYNRLHNLMQQSRSKIGMTYNQEGHTSTLPTLGTDLKA